MAPSKGWMDLVGDRLNDVYLRGVEEFLDYAFKKTGRRGEIRCPCVKCSNTYSATREVVGTHLKVYGIIRNYTFWYHHGERVGESESNLESVQQSEDEPSNEMHDILRDLYPEFCGQDTNDMDTDIFACDIHKEEPNEEANKFYRSISQESKKLILLLIMRSMLLSSTELKLFDESWITAFAATREEPVVSKESSDLESKALVHNITEITSSPKDERKESLMRDVSTIQMLSDQLKIKKKLTGSDLGNLCRLLVASLLVRNHILPLLSRETIEQIEKDGATVPVWDCDTNIEQHMALKHWHSSKSYVFIKGWMIQFVKRRNLVEGDLIGIYWDPSNSRFSFSLLERA
ncbi:hypothetical protein GH714_013284 [Hevea brasiliensis]|uniref:Transposase-associated domain-containing protein n=1 Tax=Hevea brasiliensis TaxID=3981 RepID=A0A6A6N879_HEVBR|nr:hypothetical protein GH714_013284 [Hevea brasiliensis]